MSQPSHSTSIDLRDCLSSDSPFSRSVCEILWPMIECRILHDEFGRLPWESSYEESEIRHDLPDFRPFFDSFRRPEIAIDWCRVDYNFLTSTSVFMKRFPDLYQLFEEGYPLLLSTPMLLRRGSTEGFLSAVKNLLQAACHLQWGLLSHLTDLEMSEIRSCSLVTNHERISEAVCQKRGFVGFHPRSEGQHWGIVSFFLLMTMSLASISRKLDNSMPSLPNEFRNRLGSFLFFYCSLGLQFLPSNSQIVLWLAGTGENDEELVNFIFSSMWIEHYTMLLGSACLNARWLDLTGNSRLFPVAVGLMERFSRVVQAVDVYESSFPLIVNRVNRAYASALLSYLVRSQCQSSEFLPTYLQYLREAGVRIRSFSESSLIETRTKILGLCAIACFEYSLWKMGVRIALEALSLYENHATTINYNTASIIMTLPLHWGFLRVCSDPHFDPTFLYLMTVVAVSHIEDDDEHQERLRELERWENRFSVFSDIQETMLAGRLSTIDSARITTVRYLLERIRGLENEEVDIGCFENIFMRSFTYFLEVVPLGTAFTEVMAEELPKNDLFLRIAENTKSLWRWKAPLLFRRATLIAFNPQHETGSTFLELLEEGIQLHLHSALTDGVYEIDRLILCRRLQHPINLVLSRLVKLSLDADSDLEKRSFQTTALYYAELLKSLSQVLSLSSPQAYRREEFRRVKTELLKNVDTIVAYHFSRSCPMMKDCVYRWVVKCGEIVHFDFATLEDRIDGNASDLEDLISVFSQSFGAMTRVSELSRRRQRRIIHRVEKLLNSACTKLHKLLISGLEDYLPHYSHEVVYLVPSSELMRIPFAALLDPSSNEYFVDRHSFCIVPALAMIEIGLSQREQVLSDRILQFQNRPRVEGLLCGDTSYDQSSHLAHSSTEIQTILSVLNAPSCDPSLLLVREHFTGSRLRDCFLQTLPRYVHLSTHCSSTDSPDYHTLPRSSLPMLDNDPRSFFAEMRTDDELEMLKQYRTSGRIAFHGSEFLHAESISDVWSGLRGCELVYLSACQAGDGRVSAEGVMGFHRSLFRIGVPTVVCSLWSVFDRAASEISQTFYRMVVRGVSKAEALREAILSWKNRRRRSSEFKFLSSPLIWASFQLFGCPL